MKERKGKAKTGGANTGSVLRFVRWVAWPILIPVHLLLNGLSATRSAAIEAGEEFWRVMGIRRCWPRHIAASFRDTYWPESDEDEDSPNGKARNEADRKEPT